MASPLVLPSQGCYTVILNTFETYVYLAGALAIGVLAIEVSRGPHFRGSPGSKAHVGSWGDPPCSAPPSLPLSPHPKSRTKLAPCCRDSIGPIVPVCCPSRCWTLVSSEQVSSSEWAGSESHPPSSSHCPPRGSSLPNPPPRSPRSPKVQSELLTENQHRCLEERAAVCASRSGSLCGVGGGSGPVRPCPPPRAVLINPFAPVPEPPSKGRQLQTPAAATRGRRSRGAELPLPSPRPLPGSQAPATAGVWTDRV